MKFTGGIHYGDSYFSSINATWPFADLQVEPGRATLSVSSKKFTFVVADAVRISKYRGLLSKGLRFEHANKAYPSFLIFWTFNRRAVIASLTETGFTVAEQSGAKREQAAG